MQEMIGQSKFLAIEGIDGSGKRTQLDLLCHVLEERGMAYARFAFPCYQSFFGSMVGRFLNGDYGPLHAVDAHFSALLFAGDRLEARAELREAVEHGKVVVADRYIGSNLAHQTARVAPEKRAEFLAWLKHLEYKVYDLPVEDLVVYLRVPPSVAHQLVAQKAARDYTQLQRDLQEADIVHLEQAAGVYDELAKAPNWATVECFDDAAGKMLSPEKIHTALLGAIERRAPYLVHPAKQREFEAGEPPSW